MENIENTLGFHGAEEAVVQSCSVKKVFLEISQNSKKSTCARVSFSIKLQASGLRFSCEFCKIFKNTFFQGIPPVAAADGELIHSFKIFRGSH